MNRFKICCFLLFAFIISSCYDFLAHSHLVPLENYTGKWLFTGSIYNESAPFDSIGHITLYEDSTFISDFSFFWNQDTTTQSDSLIGKWYPWETATYRDNYYIDLHIIINNVGKTWRVHGGNSKATMIWFSDDYGLEEEYYWKLVE